MVNKNKQTKKLWILGGFKSRLWTVLERGFNMIINYVHFIDFKCVIVAYQTPKKVGTKCINSYRRVFAAKWQNTGIKTSKRSFGRWCVCGLKVCSVNTFWILNSKALLSTAINILPPWMMRIIYREYCESWSFKEYYEYWEWCICCKRPRPKWLELDSISRSGSEQCQLAV